MSGINTEHKIYLKILTPVHVGDAQEKHLQKDLDFIQLKGSTWKINWDKVYQFFDPDAIANAIVNKKLDQLLENEIEEVAWEMDDDIGNSREIKSFIRDGFGKVFIPGSSIKGAMKSWLHAAIEAKLNLPAKNETLGRFENDIFRFVQPTDCYFENETGIFPTKIFNLHRAGRNWEGGWKHAFRSFNNRPATDYDFNDRDFVTDYECLVSDSLGSFTLKLRKKLNRSFKETLYNDYITTKVYNEVFENDSLLSLFHLINTQTKKHLNREIAFFEKYNQAEGSVEIMENLEKLLQVLNQLKSNQCILRLSAGSGFHGISGDFQFKDHINTGQWRDGKIKFKSRKIAFTPNEMFPMGFVLLSATPIEKGEMQIEKEVEIKNPSSTSITHKAKPDKPKISIEYKDASLLKKGDIVYAEMDKKRKPFSKVKLLLENYDFEELTDLTGTKDVYASLEVGQIIKCEIMTFSKDGKINNVRFLK